jgi:hypothetical protein
LGLEFDSIGDNKMTNIGTIQQFLNVFAVAPAGPNPVTTVMGLFSPDAGPPPTPSVGIGGNNQALGPVFRGQGQITALFTELLLSFPNLTFLPWPQPNNPVFCIAQNDPNTIMIQAQLQTGDHTQQWFPPNAPAARRFYSKPLSDLVPRQVNPLQSTVPVCAVFTFDINPGPNQFKILNLALYLDRWKFAEDLWVPGRFPFPHP